MNTVEYVCTHSRMLTMEQKEYLFQNDEKIFGCNTTMEQVPETAN